MKRRARPRAAALPLRHRELLAIVDALELTRYTDDRYYARLVARCNRAIKALEARRRA